MSQIESIPSSQENSDIKVIAGNFGKCYIEDCITHMKKLPDKCFDILFTDTLWGHDYQKNAQKPMGINQKAKKQNRTPYMDKWNPEFHKSWFEEAQRISNAQIVCVGRLHKYDWIQMFKPTWEIQVYYRNGQGSTQNAKYSAHMPYLIYGDELWIFEHLPYLCYGDDEFWKKKKFYRDVY